LPAEPVVLGLGLRHILRAGGTGLEPGLEDAEQVVGLPEHVFLGVQVVVRGVQFQ